MVDYKIAGQDIVPIIKKHNLGEKYAISANDLQKLENGEQDGALLLKFTKLVVGEKDKFAPDAREEIEKKFAPILEQFNKFRPEVVDLVINSGILNSLLNGSDNKMRKATEEVNNATDQIRGVKKALEEGRISPEDAKDFAGVIIRQTTNKVPALGDSIRSIIDAGEQNNRGGRGGRES